MKKEEDTVHELKQKKEYYEKLPQHDLRFILFVELVGDESPGLII
jgi:hypothetical protein